MKYLIIYDTEVILCEEYASESAIALGSASSMIATLNEAKVMLDAAGVTYHGVDLLENISNA